MESWLMRSRYPHAVAAGILLALAFPNCEIAGLAWVAPALILGVAVGADPKQSFRIGYVAGLAYHLTSLYWLLLIPVKVFPILGWLALSAYISLYTAVWVWGAWRLWPSGAASAKAQSAAADRLRPSSSSSELQRESRTKDENEGRTESPLLSQDLSDVCDNQQSWAPHISWPTWGRRTVWAFGVAALWVALEIIRVRLLGGFPWNILGASQFKLIPLIQISSFTGVYGVSFLVIWFSAGLSCAGLGLLRAPSRRTAWMADLGMPLLAIAISFAWGMHVINRTTGDGRELRVAVVQPSIPQTEIWNPDENASRFADLLVLTEQALAEKPDLLLWPEAAVPELLRWDELTYTAITGLARSNETWMILGADDAIPGETLEDEVTYYNSAWLVDPHGDIAATYRKQQLVAFGEEVPFTRWLPFLKWFTPITGAFTRGTEFVPFPMDSLGVEATPLICFEDVFPHLARRSVTTTTDFLVNLTNDGWFREGAAQRQQAANSVFRAVENGLPLIRCTNNGQTCWVDRFGRIVETFTDEAGSIYGAGWTVFAVSLPDQNPGRPTFYNQHGDVFGWLCAAFSISMLLPGLLRKRATDS